MTVYYLPIEPYEERYTWQLKEWTERAFRRFDVDYVTVLGDADTTSGRIDVGNAPLDPIQRSAWALSQTRNLILLAKQKPLTAEDVVYLQDVFHPGIEGILYLRSVLGWRFRIWAQNCAQSYDPYDFTHAFRHWMRHYERMVEKECDGIFVAAANHKQQMELACSEANVINCEGLPFDSTEVRERIADSVTDVRRNRVVFTSRFDAEKQPHFFMDLVEKAPPYLHWAIIQGSNLKSNDPTAVRRARELQQQGKLSIYENCTKNEYYRLLNNSAVQFNCALQDYVSNTLNEASAFDVPSVAPAFGSFVEHFRGHEDQLYVPWSLDSALDVIAHHLHPRKDYTWAAKKSDQVLSKVISKLTSVPSATK